LTSANNRRGPGRPPADASIPQLEEILERALEAFAEVGYEAVSVRQLNMRLGMGHTFVHDRFGSKDALWVAAIEYGVGQVSQEVGAALVREGQDDVTQLVSAVRAFHAAAARQPHLTRVIDYEAARQSPRLEYLYRLIEPLNNAVQPIFDRLVGNGQIRDVPWYLFVFVISKPVAMYSQLPFARMFGRPDDADDHALLSSALLNAVLSKV
jgi:TetR/AcrR family transcriptional regulator